IKDYTEAIRLMPQFTDAYINRGYARLNQQDYEEAIKDFDEAIRLNPRPSAYFGRGDACWARKDYAEAIKTYDEGVRLDPTNTRACFNLAWLLATVPKEDLRDGRRAIELAKKARDQSEGSSGWESAVLAAAYAEVGQFAE